MRSTWATLAVLVLSTHAEAAQSRKRINTISLNGPGCQDPDRRRVVITPDEQTLSVFFSDFAAETTTDERRVRTHCHMKVMLDLPPGLTVRLDTIDYRGYAYPSIGLAADGTEQVTGDAYLNREYFFGNGPLDVERSSLYKEDISFSERDELRTTEFAPCGGRAVLRAHITAIAVRGNDPNEQTSIGVETLDMKREFEQVIKLSYVPCR